jgi:hypothetical protein
MTPDDFRNRRRHPIWERELAAHVRTLPALDRLEFVRSFIHVNFPVAMALVRRCVGDRQSRLALLDDALRTASAGTMKYWLTALVPGLGVRRVDRYLAGKAGEYPKGVECAEYYMRGFRHGTQDKSRPGRPPPR